MKHSKDLNLSLRIHPISGDIVPANDATAIKNSVKHLCLYGPYDRPYEFGTQSAGLYEYLFELENSRTVSTMIYTKLMNFLKVEEPRIRVVDITASVDSNDAGITVKIEYVIIATGLPDDVVFSVIRTS